MVSSFHPRCIPISTFAMDPGSLMGNPPPANSAVARDTTLTVVLYPQDYHHHPHHHNSDLPSQAVMDQGSGMV